MAVRLTASCKHLIMYAFTDAAREMAVALARVNSEACKGTYKEPHPSCVIGPLHETFRGWSGVESKTAEGPDTASS